jgi:hypothetical protein
MKLVGTGCIKAEKPKLPHPVTVPVVLIRRFTDIPVRSASQGRFARPSQGEIEGRLIPHQR